MHELAGCDVRDCSEEVKRNYSFQIFYPQDPKKKTLYVSAESADEMREWMEKIKVCAFSALLFCYSFVFCSNLVIFSLILLYFRTYLYLLLFWFLCLHIFRLHHNRFTLLFVTFHIIQFWNPIIYLFISALIFHLCAFNLFLFPF